ncbi:alpha-tubulin N-acetyltransferase 1 isoform X2 [Sphaeramia orbicularis]|uniref:alpha-tubulin N-acetyltransferase 1 isoform X2 n=1 Tax=Sphaeramia orbicularis TaxID=375764 RepID=UPI00117C255A|nr:alpha-tubulin N-acetyltransferase 1 isoform X2 [Sphaeramia orbicularis]
MEFPFDINQLFSERVSVLDHTLVAGRKSAGRPDLQAHIATVIDELGRASAKAQQLTAPITSASKLQSQKHQLYLLKDGESNGGRGAVMGFLKVGYKKLFLLDQQGAHVEAEPLCVLDFYIAENLQRHGYGLELFDFMLQHKNLEPVLMAYDRPSPKFLSFLAKHYCLKQSIPQVNNFVVFDGFFLNRSVGQLRKVPLKKPDGEIKPYSLMEREVVRQEQRTLPWPFAPPHSPLRSVSSQYSQSLSVGSSPSRAPRAALASAPGGSRDQSPQSPHLDRCRARRTSQQGLVARCSLYSRHMDSSAVGLLDRHLPGLRAVGDQSYALGYTDTHRSHPLSLPPLSATKNDATCIQTSLGKMQLDDTDDQVCSSEEDINVADGSQCSERGVLVNQRHMLRKESDRRTGDWSWTVGVNGYTAQWVKQKQEYRSTRPW